MDRLFTEITVYVKGNGEVRLKAKYVTKENMQSVKEVDIAIDPRETENLTASANALLNEMGIK